MGMREESGVVYNEPDQDNVLLHCSDFKSIKFTMDVIQSKETEKDREDKIIGQAMSNGECRHKSCIKQQNKRRVSKHVSFNPRLKIVLITSIGEYEELGVKDQLWYGTDDFKVFRSSAKL